jgi:hypothetical protein
MKLPRLQVLTTILSLSLAASVGAANLVVNAGFEDPVTTDGAPFIGFWEAFNGAAVSSSGNSTTLPRTGLQSLELSIVNTDNTFAGAFQEVTVIPGLEYTFSGWHASLSSPLDLGTEVRIEWRNSLGEVARTPNVSPVPTSVYSLFELTAEVPAGADIARMVYAIQTFGGEPSNNGTVYVDDVSFALVPEPSSLILLGAGGLALVLMRRRRA